MPETTGLGSITADAAPDEKCAECGHNTLTVVTVTGHLGGKERTLGGWAWCQWCHATPHPTLKEAHRG